MLSLCSCRLQCGAIARGASRKLRRCDVANDRAFTVPQLARHWGCRPSRVRALIRTGDLAAFTIGDSKRLRISPASVEAYEQRHAVRQQQAKPRRCRREAVVPGWVDRY